MSLFPGGGGGCPSAVRSSERAAWVLLPLPLLSSVPVLGSPSSPESLTAATRIVGLEASLGRALCCFPAEPGTAAEERSPCSQHREPESGGGWPR